jgi:nitrous oxidase accessory protein NosD
MRDMKNKERILLSSSLVILVLAFGALTAGAASSNTWTVHPQDPMANFKKIQAAIDNSSVVDGDTIVVWNGTYNETVLVGKRLTIYSRDGPDVTIIDARGSGSAITVNADGCTIDGLKALGGGTSITLTPPSHREHISSTSPIKFDLSI